MGKNKQARIETEDTFVGPKFLFMQQYASNVNNEENVGL